MSTADRHIRIAIEELKAEQEAITRKISVLEGLLSGVEVSTDVAPTEAPATRLVKFAKAAKAAYEEPDAGKKAVYGLTEAIFKHVLANKEGTSTYHIKEALSPEFPVKSIGETVSRLIGKGRLHKSEKGLIFMGAMSLNPADAVDSGEESDS